MRARLLCCLMLLMCLSASQGQSGSKSSPNPSPSRPTPQPVDPLPPGMDTRSIYERAPGGTPRPSERDIAQAKAQQQQRLKDLKRDTDKLLELATELKKSVDASGEQTLSLQVVKKASEIEKLAHSVRNRMKGE